MKGQKKNTKGGGTEEPEPHAAVRLSGVARLVILAFVRGDKQQARALELALLFPEAGQEGLAREAGVSQATFSRLRGEFREHLGGWCEAAGVSPRVMVERA
jgi:hypothetical protein